MSSTGAQAGRATKLGSLLLVLAMSVGYFLAAVSPILAALRTNDIQWFAGGGSFFGYMISFIGIFTRGGPSDLYYAVATVYVLTPLAAWLLLQRAFRSALVAVAGSLLLLANPEYFGAATSSAYGQVAALLFLLVALHLSMGLTETPAPERLVVFFIFALATASADPATGFILGMAVLPRALRSFPRLKLYDLALPVITFAFSAILLLVSPGPALQWSFESDAVLALAAAGSVLSLFVLRSRGLSAPLTLLSAYAIAAVGISVASAEPYLVYPLVLLSSGTVLYARDAVRSVAAGAEEAVEIDVVKVAALGVLALMLVASAAATVAQAQAFSPESAFSQRYGSSSLLQAMDWIKANTPAGSVVLAEYPLSQWVQSVADRPVLTDLGVDPNSSQFARSYAADTILNATYQMSNGYFQVRDWAPVAPQRSPVIGVASGNAYVDFLYDDESHFQLLNSTGGPMNIPYVDFAKVASGFYDFNGTTGLREVYTIAGATVERDVILGSEANTTIRYFVSPPSGNVTGAQMKLWVPWNRQIGFSQVRGNTITLDLDVGQFAIAVKGPVSSMKFGPDPVWGQPDLTLTFGARSSFAINVHITAQGVKPVSWSSGFSSVSDVQLLSQYRVAFAVIPTAVKAEDLDRFGLYYPTYTSVFQNDKLTVYRITLSSP